jgi:hypothetical protein
VTRSSVYRALVRDGLVEPKSRRRREDYRRWERGTPMELWQLDVTASAFLTSGTEVKIVTGVDDHSRILVAGPAHPRLSSRRARASRNHRHQRPARCQQPACPCRQCHRRAMPEALASLRWRWTGRSRPRGTCGSAGSRSGSARPVRAADHVVDRCGQPARAAGRGPDQDPALPGAGPLNCPGWPPTAPARQALGRCPPDPGR